MMKRVRILGFALVLVLGAAALVAASTTSADDAANEDHTGRVRATDCTDLERQHAFAPGDAVCIRGEGFANDVGSTVFYSIGQQNAKGKDKPQVSSGSFAVGADGSFMTQIWASAAARAVGKGKDQGSPPSVYKVRLFTDAANTEKLKQLTFQVRFPKT